MARLVMVHVSEVSEATCLAFRMLGASGSSGEVAGCFEVAITGEGGGGECFLFHAICRKKWGGGVGESPCTFWEWKKCKDEGVTSVSLKPGNLSRNRVREVSRVF